MPRAVYFFLTFVVLVVLAFWGLGSGPNSQEGETETEFEHRALNTLPYLNWAPVDSSEEQSGVTKNVEGKTGPGLNFFNSTTIVKAYLLDMNGNEVHTWTPQMPHSSPWQHVQLLPDGSILAVAKDKYLAKISWDSKVIWIRPGRYHHDISLDNKERLYTIRRAEKLVSADNHTNYPIVDDLIVTLSSTGEELSSLSVYELVKDRMKRPLLRRALDRAKKKKLLVDSKVSAYSGRTLIENSAFDVLHTNTVLPLDRTIFEGCQKGDLLISVRNIDLIGCVDLLKNNLRWSWGQKHLSRQHHPTVLENGNILVFDNRPRAKLSEVVELNPKTSTIEWKTNGHTPKFFSVTRGSSQRLPNGNTLISESDFGRVFEVTKDQEMVWEYYNPESFKPKKSEKTKRGTFYRFMRLTPQLQEAISKLLPKEGH